MNITDRAITIISAYKTLRARKADAISVFEAQCPSLNLRYKADAMDAILNELADGYHVSQMSHGQLRGYAAVIAIAQ